MHSIYHIQTWGYSTLYSSRPITEGRELLPLPRDASLGPNTNRIHVTGLCMYLIWIYEKLNGYSVD